MSPRAERLSERMGWAGGGGYTGGRLWLSAYINLHILANLYVISFKEVKSSRLLLLQKQALYKI